MGSADASSAELDFTKLRHRMVDRQLAHRGIRSPAVLEAMRSVPREEFLSPDLREFAYDDSPLPIAAEQTISQPYIVALMAEALELSGGERVLEVGTGSGYAAAVLARLAREVYTVERLGTLAEKAAATLSHLGFANVHVRHGDGTLGWSEQAPYDAIIVAAGGPKVPDALRQQLKIGGRLLIPVGADRGVQELVRIVRHGPDEYSREELADVRFVPLVGAEGWSEPRARLRSKTGRAPERALPRALATQVERFESIDAVDLKPLLARIGQAKVVLLGEATHGTSEFYRMRAAISRALIEHADFRFIAIEGDWPDAARIDHYVRQREPPATPWAAFARFPRWMWLNEEVRTFVDWLHRHNGKAVPERRVAFHGLDLYSLYTSIDAVLDYLDNVDPTSARVARERYGCLTPWQSDPAVYGHATLTGAYRSCEAEVASMLRDLMQKRRAYAAHDGERFLDAVQNARLVANAERYYRIMYYGSRASWNLRDTHMFETLKNLLAFHGPGARAIVWAHNSHVGDSAATEMSIREEFNLGHLCREEFGERCYSIGFGTHTGTVAAATNWGEAMQIKRVRPSLPDSYERECHETGAPRFLLPLRELSPTLAALRESHLERAIGVIYRPESELLSHYFRAVLPGQFDEWIWFDETQAVTPIEAQELRGTADTYPFGL